MLLFRLQYHIILIDSERAEYYEKNIVFHTGSTDNFLISLTAKIISMSEL